MVTLVRQEEKVVLSEDACVGKKAMKGRTDASEDVPRLAV